MLFSWAASIEFEMISYSSGQFTFNLAAVVRSVWWLVVSPPAADNFARYNLFFAQFLPAAPSPSKTLISNQIRSAAKLQNHQYSNWLSQAGNSNICSTCVTHPQLFVTKQAPKGFQGHHITIFEYFFLHWRNIVYEVFPACRVGQLFWVTHVGIFSSFPLITFLSFLGWDQWIANSSEKPDMIQKIVNFSMIEKECLIGIYW